MEELKIEISYSTYIRVTIEKQRVTLLEPVIVKTI